LALSLAVTPISITKPVQANSLFDMARTPAVNGNERVTTRDDVTSRVGSSSPSNPFLLNLLYHYYIAVA
jgi:hypothetical protein